VKRGRGRPPGSVSVPKVSGGSGQEVEMGGVVTSAWAQEQLDNVATKLMQSGLRAEAALVMQVSAQIA